jgi:hypothetical protein
MSRSRWTLRAAFCCSLLAAVPESLPAETDARPAKRCTLDLAARVPGEKSPASDTPRWAVGVFVDARAKRLFYVADGGKAFAVLPAGKSKQGPGDLPPRWSHRLALPVRAFDDEEFGKDTVNVEVYRDDNSSALVFLSHTGVLAAAPAPEEKPLKAEPPRWLYRLKLRVRKGGETCFVTELVKCNVEVYHDPRSGHTVFVTDRGGVAVLPAARAREGKRALPPEWSHAAELRARLPGETRFEAKTPLFGLEVYEDDNRDACVYITEVPHLAVVAGLEGIDPEVKKGKVRGFEWVQGVRPRGTDAKAWSAERYVNPNAGHEVYITSRGAVAVLRRK